MHLPTYSPTSPRFRCNKCLDWLRIFEDNLSPAPTRGLTNISANFFTTCYHVLCNVCHTRNAQRQPNTCPVCHGRCQAMEINRSTMPMQQQVIFMPIANTHNDLQLAHWLQNAQIDFFNEYMTKNYWFKSRQQ